ncbi:MAG: 30S ribosomal protein S6 [Clostridiales bacterium]|nr:30S ribosomal protein S6 [Clostridiales bacterium]
MTDIKNKYETVFVVDTSIGEENVSAVIEKFKTLIESNGTLEKVDDWGKRRLAYPIDYKTEGHYVLIEFTSAPDFPAELDRVYKITDSLIRSLIIAKES